MVDTNVLGCVIAAFTVLLFAVFMKVRLTQRRYRTVLDERDKVRRDVKINCERFCEAAERRKQAEEERAKAEENLAKINAELSAARMERDSINVRERCFVVDVVQYVSRLEVILLEAQQALEKANNSVYTLSCALLALKEDALGVQQLHKEEEPPED